MQYYHVLVKMLSLSGCKGVARSACDGFFCGGMLTVLRNMSELPSYISLLY